MLIKFGIHLLKNLYPIGIQKIRWTLFWTLIYFIWNKQWAIIEYIFWSTQINFFSKKYFKIMIL